MEHIYYASKGARYIMIDGRDGKLMNEQGWDIHRSVNTFKHKRNRKENLHELCYWYVDADQEPKEKVRERIVNCTVMPTMVVETGGGYHLYWKAKDATVENYSYILSNLRSRFYGDKGAKGVSKMLRVPGMLQYKYNPPFRVKVVHHNQDAQISETLMMSFLKVYVPPKKEVSGTCSLRTLKDDRDDWEGLIKEAKRMGISFVTENRAECPNKEHSNQGMRPSLVFFKETCKFYCFKCHARGGIEELKRPIQGGRT